MKGINKINTLFKKIIRGNKYNGNFKDLKVKRE